MTRKIYLIFKSIVFGTIVHFKLVTCLNLILLTTQSCRKLVSDDFPDFPSSPVINSILVADRLLHVHVSLTEKIGEGKLPIVDNAEVIITSDNVHFDTLLHIGNSYYKSKIIVIPNVNYTLQVTIPGYNSIICSNSIPSAPKIMNIQHINHAARDEEGNTYPAISVAFKNNPDELQYYQIVIKLQQHHQDEELAQIQNITDPVLLNEGIPLLVFSNEIIDNDNYEMSINYTDGSLHTNLYPLIIELRAINYDYYMYLKKLYLYESGRYPEDVGSGTFTNFNLHSNIPGGYGIFAGYSSTVSDTIYPYQLKY